MRFKYPISWCDWLLFKVHFLSLQGLAGYFNSDEGPVEEGYDDTKPDGSHPAIMGYSFHRLALQVVWFAFLD